MPLTAPQSSYISKEILACLKRYWGYTQFRPWQAETILAILPSGPRKIIDFEEVSVNLISTIIKEECDDKAI